MPVAPIDNLPIDNLVAIPQPPTTPLLGNLLTLDREAPIQGMVQLAREYGPIYRLEVRGNVAVMVSGAALVAELCDETRFDKSVGGALGQLRGFAGDGLFTAATNEPNWSRAHNILLPNFSQRAMQSYHPMMLDIAGQLVAKWARLNPDEAIDVARDMTSLTLDTIGVCGFDYRFNSFYREHSHPFVGAMVGALAHAMNRMRRLPLEGLIRRRADRQFRTDIDFMNASVDQLISDRRRSDDGVSAPHDLLGYMLAGVDKKSGERLDDLNIRYQIITFLIAGHETTSGLLAFAVNALVNHPEVLAKAYEEVDRVLGADLGTLPAYAEVGRLNYIGQILKESLRLWPTAPAFALHPHADTVIGGKYLIKKGWRVVVLLPALHRDPAVWGERAELFDPENFTPAAERIRPPGAYKPFGNGQRACIGRQFALHEATLVLGMMLQRFRLLDHTRYKLSIKETLTLKPDGFRIKVRPRPDHERSAETGLPRAADAPAHERSAPSPAPAVPPHGTPLLVLYGSNLGTAEEIAHHLAHDGDRNGFATTVAPLDDFAERLPHDGAVVIVTASYNGTPPDNAVKFCAWLGADELAPDILAGVNYTVFGCGNRDWAATFQAIPRLLDERLAAHGASRLQPRGEGDARDDFDGQFQQWYRPLWSAIAERLKLELPTVNAPIAEPLYQIEFITADAESQRPGLQGARPLHVLENRELQTTAGPQSSERSTRHLELALPAGVTYRTGDHLGVVPHNHDALIERVARRFGLDADLHLRLRATGERKSFLPVGRPISLRTLLRDYVELQGIATRAQIATLAAHTPCPPERARLAALAGDDEATVARYRNEVMGRRQALIDLLEETPSCTLPFARFLELLQPLAPRYYSISSSPLACPDRCAITVAVVKGAALAGHGVYRGVCSNYLLGQDADTTVTAFIRDNGSAFRLPPAPSTPLIMVGPGTGLAPFRGFLQERAALKAGGEQVGPSLLFFGCRNPEQDFIYADELRALADAGVVEINVAFSRLDGQPKVYVQDRIAERRDRVWQLLQQGAIIYVCGDASRMAPAVQRAFTSVYAACSGAAAETAEQWLSDLKAARRYLVDVWSAA